MSEVDLLKIISEKRTGIIMFGAGWCHACKMQKPLFDDIAAAYGDDIAVGLVDTDIERNISAKFQIRSLPTIVGIQEGGVVFRREGVTPRRFLENMVVQLKKPQ